MNPRHAVLETAALARLSYSDMFTTLRLTSHENDDQYNYKNEKDKSAADKHYCLFLLHIYYKVGRDGFEPPWSLSRLPGYSRT